MNTSCGFGVILERNVKMRPCHLIRSVKGHAEHQFCRKKHKIAYNSETVHHTEKHKTAFL